MTTRTPREAFLSRVREALGRTAPSPVPTPPRIQDSLIRLAQPSPQVAELFARRAAGAGMTVHRCVPDTRWITVLAILKNAAASRVVMETPDAEFLGAKAQLAAAGLAMTDPHASPGMDASFDAHAGITGVVAAVAETGTIVVASGPGRTRSAFIVPPVHIAIVREDQIVPDLVDLWPRIRAAGASVPTALTLVSGPSKTADIEGILITGVHGPGRVHILIESDPV